MSLPLVSVVMPAYNSEKYVNRAIKSIVEQGYENWELLICDDASSDDTFSIIQSYSDSRISISRNESNAGYLLTCNKLLGEASGSLVTFQDSDDYSDPLRLETQVDMFMQDPDLGMCGTWAKSELPNSTILKQPPIEHTAISEQILKSNCFCGASIMVRSEVLKDIGVYREFFSRKGNEDYDWSARIVEKYKVANIPKYLYFIENNPQSVSRRLVDPRQCVSHEVVQFLISQRATGSDYLELNRLEDLERFERSLIAPYDRDKSKIERKNADINWYNGNIQAYRQAAVRAVAKNPLRMINWKYFLTSLSRSFTAT